MFNLQPTVMWLISKKICQQKMKDFQEHWIQDYMETAREYASRHASTNNSY